MCVCVLATTPQERTVTHMQSKFWPTRTPQERRVCMWVLTRTPQERTVTHIQSEFLPLEPCKHFECICVLALENTIRTNRGTHSVNVLATRTPQELRLYMCSCPQEHHKSEPWHTFIRSSCLLEPHTNSDCMCATIG